MKVSRYTCDGCENHVDVIDASSQPEHCPACGSTQLRYGGLAGVVSRIASGHVSLNIFTEENGLDSASDAPAEQLWLEHGEEFQTELNGKVNIEVAGVSPPEDDTQTNDA